MKSWISAGPIWAVAWLLLTSSALASGFSDFNAGLGALADGRDDDAVALFGHAIGAPDTPKYLLDTAYFDRGSAYLAKGVYGEAVADFDRALALRPGWISANLYRGSARVGLGQFDGALADFSAAIAAQPSIADGYLARATANLFQKNYDAAVADYTTIISHEPKAAYGYLWRGAAYRQASRYSEALDDENKALDIDGRSAEALFQRALTYRAEEQFSHAISDFKAGLHLAPDSRNGRLNLGMTQWEAGNDRDATEVFKAALKIQSASAYAAIWLWITGAGGKDDDAAFAANAAASDTGGWPGAVVAYYLGNTKQADLFAAAGKGDPFEAASQHCEADFYSAVWQYKHGDAQAAQALLDDAIHTCPHDVEELTAAKSERKRMGSP